MCIIRCLETKNSKHWQNVATTTTNKTAWQLVNWRILSRVRKLPEIVNIAFVFNVTAMTMDSSWADHGKNVSLRSSSCWPIFIITSHNISYLSVSSKASLIPFPRSSISQLTPLHSWIHSWPWVIYNNHHTQFFSVPSINSLSRISTEFLEIY